VSDSALRLVLPTIELGEVRLRPWAIGDAPALVLAWSDPTITEHAEPPRDRSLSGAEHWIDGTHERCRVGLALDLAVAVTNDDRVVGEVGLSSIDRRRGAALVGWWISASERGAGLGTAAVAGFVDWVLTHTGLEVVVAEIGADNHASWHVAEACGFEVLRAPEANQSGALVRRDKNPD